jgi:hypothetical protein
MNAENKEAADLRIDRIWREQVPQHSLLTSVSDGIRWSFDLRCHRVGRPHSGYGQVPRWTNEDPVGA